MKKLFIALIPILFAGCTLDSISEQGSACPEDGIGKLSYIEDAQNCHADNPESCTIQGITYNYASNFQNNICPALYSSCQSKTNHETGDTIYYCSQTTVDCVDGTTLCELPDGERKCIDPSSDKTCGAKCTPEKINGQNCKAINPSSTCVLQNGEYTCRCSDNSLLCDTCIAPSAPETCGAHDCSLENYGGMNCNQIENMRCIAGDDETYSCQCATGYIFCDGKCINASFNDNYCGALGTCSSPDASSPDFKGMNCAAGGGRCNDGKCECTFGYWCTIEGSEQPQCVNPNNKETCNAILDETTGICTITPCQENEQCKAKSSTEYFCDVTGCLENQQLCPELEGNVCYSKYDMEHCGNCYTKCTNFDTDKYQAVGCEDNGESPACTFKCRDNQTNCGTAFAPVCVDITSDIKNCGTCNKACSSSQTCENGQCLNTNCAENECTSKDSNGDQICINHDAQCGPNCTPCKNIHANSYCLNGTCVISECNAGEHPIFNQTGHITECRKNSVTACAPANRKTSDPIVNCETSKDAHVGSVKCGNDGYCAIVSCVDGYHLSSDKTSCVQNSETACGTTTSSATQNCNTSITNSAATKCDHGTCKVTACAANYHPDSNYTNCIQNTTSACGTTTSPTTQNCHELDHVNQATCSDGKCVVQSCNANYHITNSSKTSCTANSHTSCAATHSYQAVNCSAGIQPYCVSGTCKCSTDGSLVLNFNDTACINKACEGVYGIVDAELNTSKCIATSCASGYKYDYDSSHTWAVCRYISTSTSECKSKLPGVTSAKLMSGTLCQATACSSSYTLSHGVCYPN